MDISPPLPFCAQRDEDEGDETPLDLD